MKRMKHSKKSLAIVLMLTLMGIGTVSGTPDTVCAASTGTVGVSALNLRSGASTGAGVISVLGKGAEVTITETSGDWYKVTATVGGSKKNGYVYSSYVQVGGQSSQTGNSGNGTVNVNGLRIRSKASTNAAILATVNSGTRVTILGTEGDWYKVGLNFNGTYTTGYMYKSYVTASSAAAPSGSQQTTAASGKGIVNTPVLNVRAAATTSSSRIGCIYQGASVTITGVSGDWYKVKVSVNGKNTEGYVSAQYITKSQASENAGQTTDQVTEKTGKGKVNASALNVRSSATTASKVLTCLKQNTVVTLQGQSGDWYKISVESNGAQVTGYVYAQYITEISADESEGSQQPSGTEQAMDKKIGTVNTAVLNLRAKATTASSVIGALYKGGTVTVTAVSSDKEWYKVEAPVNGRTMNGYVFAQYIDLTDKAPSENQGEGDESGNGSFTDEEVNLLAATVYCEAGNQSYEGKLAVANVVLNRIKSPQFPNTMKEVLYQKGQFSPASSGRLEAAISRGLPADCVKAAKDAIAGNNNVEGYYFFNTVVNTSKVAGHIKIGDHIFYHY